MMNASEVMVIVLEAVIAVMSVFGNFLVILAVYRHRQLRTMTNYFIVSLAVADLLVGVLAIPFAILSERGYPHNSFYGCLFINSAVIVLTQSSIFSLLSIGIERYAAICHVFLYQRWATTKSVCCIIVFTWLAAAFIGFLPLMGWNKRPGDISTCQFMEVVDMNYMVYFNFFVCVLPPLIILLVIYIYIFYVVWKQTQRICALEVHNNTNGNAKHNKSSAFKNLKAAKSLSSIVGLFALCWLPIHTLNSIFVICGPEKCPYPVELLKFAVLLSHANSMINPLIYAVSNSSFKRAFSLLLGCGKKEHVNSLSIPIGTVLGERRPESSCSL